MLSQSASESNFWGGMPTRIEGVGYCLLLHRVQWSMCMPFGYEILHRESTAAVLCSCSGGGIDRKL